MATVKRWFCDTCGDVLKRAKGGWPEWLTGGMGSSRTFRIVHRAARRREGGVARPCTPLPVTFLQSRQGVLS
jgi:hypothetical protein